MEGLILPWEAAVFSTLIELLKKSEAQNAGKMDNFSVGSSTGVRADWTKDHYQLIGLIILYFVVNQGILMISGEDNKKSFWNTIPGILAGIAAVLTAIGGLIVAYYTLFPGTGAPANQLPTIDAIEFNLESPSAMGEPILITIKANDSEGDKIYYRFMIKGPKDQEFMSPTGWYTDNKWEWIPTDDEVGINKIRVYVRDEKHLDEEDNYVEKIFKITKDASALTSDALVLYGQGKYDEAIKAYGEAIKLDPNYKEAFYNKGLALAALDKRNEAIQAYNEAIKLDPNYKEAFFNRGLALAALNKRDEAIQAYDEAIKLDPNYKEAFFNRGLAFAALNNYDEAIKAYDEAIKLDPNYKEAFYNKGLALAALHKRNEAIQAYNEAIKLDPNYKEAFFNRGLAFAALNNYDEAIKAYDEAIKLDPNYKEAFYNKGLALATLDKRNEAIQAYDEAIKLDPNYKEAFYNKGLALDALDNCSEAIEAYDEAIKLDPNFEDAIVAKESANKGGFIRVKCNGIYNARFTLSYRLEGAPFKKESGNIKPYAAAERPIPACATDIHLKVEEEVLLDWRTVFTTNYDEPVTKCFTVSGDFLKLHHEETNCPR